MAFNCFIFRHRGPNLRFTDIMKFMSRKTYNEWFSNKTRHMAEISSVQAHKTAIRIGISTTLMDKKALEVCVTVLVQVIPGMG
jgi:hypothetical protein